MSINSITGNTLLTSRSFPPMRSNNSPSDPGAGNPFVNGDVGIGSNAISSAFLAVAAGTTTKSQIKFAASTAPTSPNNGGYWFDGDLYT